MPSGCSPVTRQLLTLDFIITLQPRLDGSVLLIEVGHVLERREKEELIQIIISSVD